MLYSVTAGCAKVPGPPSTVPEVLTALPHLPQLSHQGFHYCRPLTEKWNEQPHCPHIWWKIDELPEASFHSKLQSGLYCSPDLCTVLEQAESSFAGSSKLPPWNYPSGCHSARAILKITAVTNWYWYFSLLIKAVKPDRYTESLLWTDTYVQILIKNPSYFWRKKVKEHLGCPNLHLIKFLVVTMSRELEAVCFKSIISLLTSSGQEHFLKKYITFQSNVWDLFQKLFAEGPGIQLYI